MEQRVMSRDEVKKLIGGIIIAYPNYKPTDMQMTVMLYEDMLKDYTYQECMVSVKRYIATDTSGFAPGIGAIIQGIPKVDEEIPNEMYAWALVSKALRNGYYGAEKEFNNLPPIVQKAVGSPDNLRNWSQTDLHSIETVIQSNFIKTYRTYLEMEKQKNALPESLRLEMQKIEEQKRISQNGNDGTRNLYGIQTSQISEKPN